MIKLALALVVAAAADPRPSARQAVTSDPPYHGLAIQIHPSDDPVTHYGRLIREVAELGADTVLLSANAYQEHVDSLVIEMDPSCSPDQWLALLALAHGHGMRVVLMPKVLLSDPRGGAWRGKIRPPSWDAWFDQYEAFIIHFARLAQRGGVEVFLVGTELISTEKHTERWRRLIAKVREVYFGKLAYSANWDHYKGIRFWPDLDLIGLTTYFNLNESEKPRPTVADLREAWQPIRDQILTWRAKIDRPLLFTEVGWCSQEGCSVEPWNYYHNEKATPAGHQEQAANYQAFIDTWAGRPEVSGILWWEWTTAPGGNDDYDYTPRNKPALEFLRHFFQRQARANTIQTEVEE
jgi:hypothetical protein